MLPPDQVRYLAAYQTAKERVNSLPSDSRIAMIDEPPNLDMRVRMIFDEDFNTMVFPRVKEMIFRLSSDSPFEIAAKALA